ncbi:MAG: hypothetical protein JWS10_637 [Cypionkella sp.]|uniref:hypothetical protein n=1 Tax=Cypionkella sp. TaxID=2811411 RepID=UPI002627CC7F|nr:hypothetical protein [Cypionkella sp.]MDB5658022.1 hypothetical protein [Cypionkella sp.]
MSADDLPLKSNPLGISELNLNKQKPQDSEAPSAVLPSRSRSALEPLAQDSTGAALEQATGLGGVDGSHGAAEALAKQLSGLGGDGYHGAAEALAKQVSGFGGLDGYQSAADAVRLQMSNLLRVTGDHSPLSGVARNIVAQQDSLDDFNRRQAITSTLPTIPHVHSVVNPLLETNIRLGRIEDQFDRISEMASQSAQNTLSLQATGAGFLQTFQKAASESATAGKLTMGVAVIALLISGAQIFAPKFMVDDESEALRLEVVNLNAKIAQSQKEQAVTSKNLIDAISESDEKSTQRLIDAISLADRATAAAVKEGIAAGVKDGIAAAIATKPPVSQNGE